MSTCPNCQKPVDTLRSRHVSVRDGKIVAYCSAECLAAATTQPVRSAVPKPVPKLDSEPVIEIVHEPVSGVVTSAPDKRKSAPVAVQTPPGEPIVEKAPEKTDKTDKADKPEKPKRRSEKKLAAERPVDKASPKLAETTAAEAMPVSAAAVAESAAQPAKRTRRDSNDERSGFEWLDDEPAEPVGPRRRRDAAGDDENIKPRSRGLQIVLVIGILALLGAGGYFAYERYLKKSAAVAPAPGDAAPLVVEPPAIDAGPPPVDAAAVRKRVLDAALGVLRETLEKSQSLTIRQKVALSLSRTNDAKAIAFLADALPRAKSETERFEIAYALARANDPRGRDALLAATKESNRDTRLAAGKKLALLGDKAAIAPLSPYIDTRFEVAKLLAPLGEPRAIKELEKLRREGKGDEKKLSTIALVAIGKSEFTPEVTPLLEQRDFRHDASVALAEHRDPSARKVLVDNLGKVGTQSEVARALRRMEPAADLTPQLVAFEKILGSEKDTEQLGAADTILLLAGPEEWLARP